MANSIPPSDEDEHPIEFTMTLDQFLRRARDRGVMLRTERSKSGRLVLTDGRKRQTLPLAAEGYMIKSLIGNLLYHFCEEDNVELLLTEFHFDPTIDEED